MARNPVQQRIENRNNFPQDELANYEDKWVAWSKDCSRIVAAADDLDNLEVLLKAAGLELTDTVLEYIPPLDMAFLGAGG